jgi:hypothetical protein
MNPKNLYVKWIGFIRLWIGICDELCEHDNESQGFIKGTKFLDDMMTVTI